MLLQSIAVLFRISNADSKPRFVDVGVVFWHPGFKYIFEMSNIQNKYFMCMSSYSM
jgi:hypothetical protein